MTKAYNEQKIEQKIDNKLAKISVSNIFLQFSMCNCVCALLNNGISGTMLDSLLQKCQQATAHWEMIERFKFILPIETGVKYKAMHSHDIVIVRCL